MSTDVARDAWALSFAVLVAVLLHYALTHAPKWLGPNGKLVKMVRAMSKTDEIKSYGGSAKTAQKIDQPFSFRLVGLRYDEEEAHEFRVIRKADALLAMRFMGLDDEQAGDLARLVVLLVGKTLDNSDGVPVQWSPEALEKPRNAGPKWEPKFRPPDGGELRPMREAGKYTAFEAGSSRRRWEALLVDNQFTVELEVLVEICKDLIEATTSIPTDG